MAQQIPVSLFFQGYSVYGINEIAFDLVLSESHDFQTIVSVHPIEDGSQISDHIQNAIRTGGLTGLITNYSIRMPEWEILGNTALDIYDLLKELWENQEPVTISTIMDVYEDVVITQMPIARDGDTGDAMVIQVNFQQVKKVKLQEIALDIKVKNLGINRNRQIAKKTNAGRTTVSEFGLMF